jgi:diguanylate cyclase (GGDEF)-like protein
LVDDEPMNLDLLERSLFRKYEVLRAEGPEPALEILRNCGNGQNGADVALILSDYRMPGMNGTQFLAEAIKYSPLAKRVIITGYADVEGIIDAINQGHVDYFVKKPWNTQELDRTLDHLVHMQRLETQNRKLLDELTQRNEALHRKERLLETSLDERGRELLSANTELEKKTRELAVLAFRDGLTGLYNHRTFHERLREEMARSRRYSRPMALIFCDLDHFKALNEQYGHPYGDEILKRVGEILRGEHSGEKLRESDVVARYGGEEFVLLLPETPKAGAKNKAERLCGLVQQASLPMGRRVTMSFGVAGFPEDAKNAEELIACADHALYLAKHGGRNQVQVYGDGAKNPQPPTVSPTDVVHAAAGEPGDAPPGMVWGAPLEMPPEDFPLYHERLPSLVAILERERALGSLYVDLTRLRRVEMEYGVSKHGELVTRVGKILCEMQGRLLRAGDLLCRAEDGDGFVYFLSLAGQDGSPRGAPHRELEKIAQSVQEEIDAALAREVFDLVHDHPRIAVGYARVLHNPMTRSERLVSKLAAEAKESAALMRRRQRQKDKDLLQEIILKDGLTPVYQPIVHLESGDIFGYEALTRGPRQSPLEAPLALFSVAEDVDLLFELDRACFRNGMRGAVGLEPIHRLFVNLLPLSFYDASFIESEVTTLLEAADLTPANVVFEITERLAIENFSAFRRALAVYTDMGFGVAIDDVGTKHSNLEAVMALRPHFVKLSDVLTRGAAKSTVKREMLRSLGRISEAIDAVMVAEGIETPEDLLVLKDLGIKYGQGYLLARPGAPFPRMRSAIRKAVRSMGSPASREAIPMPPVREFDEDEDEFREPTRPNFNTSNHPFLGDGFDEESNDGSQSGPADTGPRGTGNGGAAPVH